ncbi:MAG TPA: hypothetical protein VGN36_02540, partial [Sphingorhabdus sp.]|nr:hypothetical protein [Sphingorhabdus sp.]
NGGVAMVRYYGQSGYQDNWSGDLRKTTEGSTEVVTINFGKISDRFTKQGGVWVSAKGNGATLTETVANAEFAYKTADGTQIVYKSPTRISGSTVSVGVDMPGGYCSSSNALACGLPVSKDDPDGQQYALTWHAPDYCTWPANEPQSIENQTCQTVYRLSDVRSNSGYGMKVKYQGNSTGNNTGVPSSWFVRSGLRFFDLSQAYCDAAAYDCDGVAGSWPTVSYSVASGVFQIVNDQAGTWRLENASDGSFRVRRPGQSTDNIIVNYSGGRVSSITTDGQNKSYSWSTSGGNPSVSTSDGVGTTGAVITSPVVTTVRPASVTDGVGQATSYLYDSNGRVTRETRPEGDYTAFTYDARGNVTETRHVAKAGSGLADIVTTADYDASCSNAAKCNKPNWVRDAKGNQTDYTYDATHGELTRVQMPAATTGGTRGEVNYVYSSLSAQIRDAGGNLVAQPAQAKLTQVTTCATAATCSGSANETKISIAYNTPNLLPTSVTTAAGDGSISSTVTYAYDARDNLASIDGPLAGSDDMVTYIYDAQDRQRGVIGADPDGSGSRPRVAERYTFDAESRVSKVETGTVTAATETALNAMSVSQTIDIDYDSNGKKVRETVSGTSGAYQVVQLAYDADNRLSCTALRMNPAAFGSLPSSACTLGTQGSGAGDYGPDRITKTSYDANDRVTLVQTAYGTAEQANELTSAYTPNGRTWFVYDAANNLTAYAYDGHDRLQQTRYPVPTKGALASSSTDFEYYVHDANGNVTSRTLRDGTNITYAYDNLDRLVAKDLAGSGIDADVSYAYDLLGRLTLASEANGHDVGLGHDALGRLVSESSLYGGTKTSQYDGAGRRTRLTHADGFYAAYDYDVTGNVTHIRENGATSGIGVLATYGYDDLGRRASVTYGNGVVQSMAYDANQRLQALASNPGGTTSDQTASLTYNPAGQIDALSKSNTAYAWAGHYNRDTVSAANGLNQLTATTPGSGQASIPTLTYDAKGNLAGIGSATYGYSQQNLLWNTSQASGQLYYDSIGRLDYNSIGQSGGNVTLFDYDGTNLTAERNASGTITRRYVHGPNTDEPIVWYEGNGTSDRRFLTADERGSITAVSNASGTVTNVNSYDEYGVPASTNVGRFQYTGQTWLPELGMYYYKARIY